MEIKGEFEIPAPRQQVWDALNDPEVLRQCVPGCQEIEKISDTELVAKAVLKIGPVKASFKGKITLSDLDPPNSYKISGEGQGGVAGFASGEAGVHLDDRDGATVLSYAANAEVGGKIAQVGQRLLDMTAQKVAKEFFSKFSEVVTAEPEKRAVPVVESQPAGIAPGIVVESSPAGIAPGIWVVGVIVVAAVLLVILGL